MAKELAFLLYPLTALAEITGCFAFYLTLRLEKSAWWIPLGIVALLLFALLLTLHPVPAAGRVYAAYGGIYILGSLIWLWGVEGIRPDRWDLLGGAICLIGACVIYFGPRDA